MDQAQLESLKDAGYALSNIAYNLAQQEGSVITAAQAQSMRNCYYAWDKAASDLRAITSESGNPAPAGASGITCQKGMDCDSPSACKVHGECLRLTDKESLTVAPEAVVKDSLSTEPPMAALPELVVEDLLVLAVEHGLIRMSQIMNADLQEKIVKFAKALLSAQSQSATTSEAELHKKVADLKAALASVYDVIGLLRAVERAHGITAQSTHPANLSNHADGMDITSKATADKEPS